MRIESRREEILAELEGKKRTLAGELDDQNQQLQHELGIERQEIDQKLSRLNEARTVVSEYRHPVQTMRLYGYNADDVEPIQRKLVALRDSFRDIPQLYQAWALFYQKVRTNQASQISSQSAQALE